MISEQIVEHCKTRSGEGHPLTFGAMNDLQRHITLPVNQKKLCNFISTRARSQCLPDGPSESHGITAHSATKQFGESLQTP